MGGAWVLQLHAPIEETNMPTNFSYNTGARPVKRKSPVEEVLSTPAAVPTPGMATAPLPTAVKPVAPAVDPAVQNTQVQPAVAPATTGVRDPGGNAVTTAGAGPGPTDPPTTVDIKPLGQDQWQNGSLTTTPVDKMPSGAAFTVKGQSFQPYTYAPPVGLTPSQTQEWETINQRVQGTYDNLRALQQRIVENPDPQGFINQVGADPMKFGISLEQWPSMKEKMEQRARDMTVSGRLPGEIMQGAFDDFAEFALANLETDRLQQKAIMATFQPAGSGTTLPGAPTGTTTPTQPTGTTTTTAGDSLAGSTAPQGSVANYEKYKGDPSQHPEGIVGFMRDQNAARAAGVTITGGVNPEVGGGTTTTTPTTTPNPAQSELDAFLQTSPADHPGGIEGWTRQREALKAKVAATTTKTTVTEGDTIKSRSTDSALVDDFVTKLIKDGYELSAEEEATIRREMGQATQRALSTLSARGLGRSSEAVGAIVQGEIGAETAVGQAKARVRAEGTEAGLKASALVQSANELNLNKTVADRNYQLATRDQNLNALKNEQDVSFQDRAMDLKELDSAAAIKQMEQEFGLKIDAQAWEQFKQGKELDFTAIDLDQTNTFRNAQLASDFVLKTRDQDIEQALGISRIDLERAINEKRIDLDKMELALSQVFKNLDIEIKREEIRAAVEAAEGDDSAFAKFMGIMSIGIKGYEAFTGGD